MNTKVINTNKYKCQISTNVQLGIGLQRSCKIFLFVFIGIYLFGIPTGISAQSRIPLIVAPARQTVALDAGKTENLVIKFFNESEVAVSGNLKAIDFIVTDKDGSPILLEDQENDWIKLPYDRATIAAGDVLRVNFKVTVPKDTLPGGRYIAIMFEQTGQLPENKSDSEGASAVSSRIVGLVSVRINGAVYESAFVDIFKIPTFLEFGPVPVYFEILNKGGLHISPVGQLTLTNWFSKEVDNITLESKNIFPNAKRIYEERLGKTWMFGRYIASLTASYGEQGKTLTINQFVWVIPITLILIIIFGIIIISLLTVLIINKFKAKQVKLEEKLEEEITELESLKNKFKDKLPR